jgi:hypothetical protein
MTWSIDPSLFLLLKLDSLVDTVVEENFLGILFALTGPCGVMCEASDFWELASIFSRVELLKNLSLWWYPELPKVKFGLVLKVHFYSGIVEVLWPSFGIEWVTSSQLLFPQLFGDLSCWEMRLISREARYLAMPSLGMDRLYLFLFIDRISLSFSNFVFCWKFSVVNYNILKFAFKLNFREQS